MKNHTDCELLIERSNANQNTTLAEIKKDIGFIKDKLSSIETLKSNDHDKINLKIDRQIEAANTLAKENRLSWAELCEKYNILENKQNLTVSKLSFVVAGAVFALTMFANYVYQRLTER